MNMDEPTSSDVVAPADLLTPSFSKKTEVTTHVFLAIP